MNYLPTKLAKLRKHYSYSQSFLADYLKVDTLEYMNYENGNSMINYAQMKKLANLYQIPMIEIFLNNEDVTLYDVKDQNTDEINARYFMQENKISNRFKEFLIEHKLASSIIGILLVAIIILSIVLSKTVAPYEIKRENINRLSVSQSTVVYINESGAIGFSGSNVNGQLNDLATTSAIKVCEGSSFTVCLQEDGSLISSGLLDRDADTLSSWKNIVDIGAGDNFVVGVDSNGRVYCIGDDKACEVAGTKNIKKVFALSKAAILLSNVGSLSYAGTLIGSSVIATKSNIIDLDGSDNILVILNSDNTVSVNSKTGSYIKSESLSDIVDVACGNDFVAALDSYGKVHIEIDNDEIIDQVDEWSNIIAIDAGSDYLIGFDGKNIYGVGNNDYDQFKKDSKKKITLEKVSEISYVIDEDKINISFKGVDNADAYLISLNVGTGLSKRIDNQEVVEFSTLNMIEGKTYTISIISMGNENYKDSDEATLNFVYQKPIMVEVDTSEYIGKSVEEFESYLDELGISYQRQISSNTICENGRIVLDIIEFEDGKYNKDDLDELIVKYTCCKVE